MGLNPFTWIFLSKVPWHPKTESSLFQQQPSVIHEYVWICISNTHPVHHKGKVLGEDRWSWHAFQPFLLLLYNTAYISALHYYVYIRRDIQFTCSMFMHKLKAQFSFLLYINRFQSSIYRLIFFFYNFH